MLGRFEVSKPSKTFTNDVTTLSPMNTEYETAPMGSWEPQYPNN